MLSLIQAFELISDLLTGSFFVSTRSTRVLIIWIGWPISRLFAIEVMTAVRTRRYAASDLTGCGTAMSSQTLLVLTTCGNAEEARSLAVLLIEQRLAACVNALDKVTSTYRWQDRVQQDQETLLVIKTTAARYAAVEQAIRAHSKYELPEVLAIPVAAGSSAYLDWIGESVVGNED